MSDTIPKKKCWVVQTQKQSLNWDSLGTFEYLSDANLFKASMRINYRQWNLRIVEVTTTSKVVEG